MIARAPLIVFALLVATGCTRQADAGAETPSDPPALAEETPAVETGSGDGSVAQAQNDDGPAVDRYPGLLFQLLDGAERTRYVTLAEAELCPCEGAMQSLDACLQSEDVCELGLQAGALMMRFVKEGAEDVEITDGVQTFVQNARRVWEFDLSDTPCVGPEDAAITLVNFSDFECPHCAEFSHALHTAIEAHPDALRVCFKQYPLLAHPNATAAAVAAIAAHRQGRFIEYHDLVFAQQSTLSAADDPTSLLMSLANELGLNTERFIEDANSESARQQVDADRAEGTEAQLSSTPTCFFNGVKMMDGYSEEELMARITEALED